MNIAKLLLIVQILLPFECFSQSSNEIIDSISQNFIITVVLNNDSIIDEISLNENKIKNNEIQDTTFGVKHKKSYYGTTDEFRVKFSAQTIEGKTPYFDNKGEILVIEFDGGDSPLRSIILFEDKLVGYDKFDAKISKRDKFKYLELDSVNSFFEININYFLDTSVRCIKIFEKMEESIVFIDKGKEVIKYGAKINFERYKKNKEICIDIIKNYSTVRKIYIRKENDEYYYKRTFHPPAIR